MWFLFFYFLFNLYYHFFVYVFIFFLTFLSNFYFFVILYEWHSDGAYDRVLYFDIPICDIEYVNGEFPLKYAARHMTIC